MLLDYIQPESRRMKKVMEVEASAAQMDVEEMDCCQKNEEMVIDSDSDTIVDSAPVAESTLLDSEDNTQIVSQVSEEEKTGVGVSANTTPPSGLPRPLSLISCACGLGLSILAFRARMEPRS